MKPRKLPPKTSFELKKATDIFFWALAAATEEERKEAIQYILEHYCQYCGSISGRDCCCMRDD